MTEYESQTGTYVLLDSDGHVIAKADVPAGMHPVPDETDTSKSFDIDGTTDLQSMLEQSPADLPNPLPVDPAETAFEKLQNVSIDTRHEPD